MGENSLEKYYNELYVKVKNVSNKVFSIFGTNHMVSSV